MANLPTAEEQLLLELANRFRMDPGGEYVRLAGAGAQADVLAAMRHFGVNAAALKAQLAALGPAAPLAWNSALADAATAHNSAMIAADQQTHQAPGEPGLGERATKAGYTWSTLGENVFAFANGPAYAHAGLVIDWGYDREDLNGNTLFPDWQRRGDGIQDPAGHRASLISSAFTEVGIAITAESNGATAVGPFVVTQDLGNRRDYKAQFLGVVIDDKDGDDFYDVGEGLRGVTVTLTSGSLRYITTSWGSGGWQIAVPAGTYTIAFSGGGLTAPVVKTATLGTVNVKVDAEAADAVPGLPTAGNDVLTGTAAADLVRALAGNDIVRGGGGNDRLFGDNGDDQLFGDAGADTLDGGAGVNRLTGGSDNDTYVVRNGPDVVTELAGEGVDTVHTFVSHTLRANVENAVAQVGDLIVNGNAQANVLTGSAATDRLNGAAGNDHLAGNGGTDHLRGGLGADRLSGGTGADRFIFDDRETGATMTAADHILRFNRSEGDRIDMSLVDAVAGTAADDRFTFIGTSVFRGVAGELRYVQTSSGVTWIQGDLNGDKRPDLLIAIDHLLPLATVDFIL